MCFPGCDFRFQRALICSTDTWEPSAVSSRGGDTLTGRGIRANWPLTPPSATSLPLGRKSLIQCAHTCMHIQTHHAQTAEPHTHTRLTSHQRHIIALSTLTQRSLDKCLSWMSQTFVGTGHPFEVISECRLSSNQVREYSHLCRGHIDLKDGKIKRNVQSHLSPQCFVFLSWFCRVWCRTPPHVLTSSWGNTEHWKLYSLYFSCCFLFNSTLLICAN